MNKSVVLRKPPQGSVRFGHPWVYKNQIKEVSHDAEAGDVLSVVTESGKPLGLAYWNPKSEIALRLLTRKNETIDKAWFRHKIHQAILYRQGFEKANQVNSYRLISSEADDLSGLIVDKYDQVLVIQFLTLGMDRLRQQVIEALKDELPHIRGIYERSDSSWRKLEGLSERVGWIEKNCGDEICVREKDLEIHLNLDEGHKTGWYLDQSENRLIVRDLAVPNGKALDVFCYQGAFGLHLAKAGMQVLGIDSQANVLEQARLHAKRNKLSESQIKFEQANAFDKLKELEREKASYDLIVLDPPSFVKQKAAVSQAMTGYKELLRRAFKMLNDNGRLAVFSCAYYFDDNLLIQASLTAAQEARKPLKLVKFLKQAADHPIKPFIPETYYLKGFVFQACQE